MANLHLITGHSGTAHITSADSGVINSYSIGKGRFVFGGERYEFATTASNNAIRIKSGVGIFDGRVFEIEKDAYVDVDIASVTYGKERIDKVCLRYSYDTETTVESLEFVVVSGDVADSDPVVPTSPYEVNSIMEGHINVDYPMFAVHVKHDEIPSVTQLFTSDSRNIGEGATCNGFRSYAIGQHSSVSGNDSVAEGARCVVSGEFSHAEGYSTKIYKNYSHAEGFETSVYGNGSHAEGNNSNANGSNSHAEGYYTNATGDHSHAEGLNTTANGEASHSQNAYTSANYNYQTAIGIFNQNKEGDLFEIGNGTDSDNRKNAFEVTNEGVAKAKKFKTIDGKGVVMTVNGEEPDSNGNVQVSGGGTGGQATTLVNTEHYDEGRHYGTKSSVDNESANFVLDTGSSSSSVSSSTTVNASNIEVEHHSGTSGTQSTIISPEGMSISSNYGPKPYSGVTIDSSTNCGGVFAGNQYVQNGMGSKGVWSTKDVFVQDSDGNKIASLVELNNDLSTQDKMTVEWWHKLYYEMWAFRNTGSAFVIDNLSVPAWHMGIVIPFGNDAWAIFGGSTHLYMAFRNNGVWGASVTIK